MVRRDRRENVPSLRIDLTSVRLCGPGAFVDEQKAVVGRDDEPPDARIAEEFPGRTELLHHEVKYGWTNTLFTRPIDLVAVYQDQPGACDRLLEARRFASHDVVERE